MVVDAPELVSGDGVVLRAVIARKKTVIIAMAAIINASIPQGKLPCGAALALIGPGMTLELKVFSRSS